MDVTKALFRFIVLFFNCLLTFGSYFCFDMPSVLQAQFTGNITCSNFSLPNETCGEDCLGMTENEYNLLYAIYSWTNALVVIAAGFLIDKVGNRTGAFLFSFLCVLGSAAVALGAMLKGTAAMLPVMLIGRLLFGAGNGSLTIVQNRITAFWFRGKELAMAFGITLAFSRLGSVLNFFLTESFAEKYGTYMTLWGGAILCGIGFISAIIVSNLDIYGIKKLGQSNSVADNSKRLKFTDIRHFSLQYWLLTLSIMFFYNGVFPFVADASKFMQDKYSYSSQSSSYIAGAAYDVSMILSPFLGGVIDIVGLRALLSLACAGLTLPVFGLLAFSYVYPLVIILWLGVTYSFAAASLWPSIPLVIPVSTVGTAMGVTTSIQNIGIGISNLIVGAILGQQVLQTNEMLKRWKYVMVFLFFNTVACILTTALLNIVDRRRGNVLNMSRKERRRLDEMRSEIESSIKHETDEEISSEEPSETDPLLTADRGRTRASIN